MVSLTGGTNPSDFGDSLTYKATVTHDSGGAGTPTGTVNFYDGVTLLGSGTLGGGATTTYTTAALTTESHAITAQFVGDVNFNTSTSADFTQNVDFLEQTITFPTQAGVVYGDAPFALIGVVGGGSVNPVTFASTTPTVCSVSGSTVTIATAGSCSITASQLGDVNYNDAPDVTQTINIAQKSIDFNCNG